jgi:hypothetical protein
MTHSSSDLTFMTNEKGNALQDRFAVFAKERRILAISTVWSATSS